MAPSSCAQWHALSSLVESSETGELGTPAEEAPTSSDVKAPTPSRVATQLYFRLLPALPPRFLSTRRRTWRESQSSTLIRSSRHTHKPTRQTMPLVSVRWKPRSLTSIMGSLIWSAKTSVNSATTTSTPPVRPAPIKCLLQPCSSVVGPVVVCTSITGKTMEWLLCRESSLKLSWERISDIPGRLWIPSGVRLSRTPNTNKKEYSTGFSHQTSSSDPHRTRCWRSPKRVLILLQRAQTIGQGPNGTTWERAW